MIALSQESREMVGQAVLTTTHVSGATHLALSRPLYSSLHSVGGATPGGQLFLGNRASHSPFDRRKDVECQAFFRKVVKSPIFQVIMISTITSNAAFMVLGTDYSIMYRLFRLFEVSTQML